MATANRNRNASKQAAKAIQINLPNFGKLFSKLQVTAADIKEGKGGSAAWCPIALAARRQCGALAGYITDVDASDGAAKVTLAIPFEFNGIDLPDQSIEVTVRADLGDKADDFMSKFDDDRKTVKPITFKASVDVDADIITASM